MGGAQRLSPALPAGRPAAGCSCQARQGKGPPREQGSPSKSACGNGSTTSEALNGGGSPPPGLAT